MLDPRWQKVRRDVWLHKARTLLVVLAIATGLAGAGTILNAWALVRRATEEGYHASDPAAATLRTNSIDAALLVRVRAVPGVRDAQARRTATAAAQVQGGYKTAILFAADSLSTVRIGRLQAEAGVWPPTDGAIVVERSSVAFAQTAVGESLSLAVNTRAPQSLPVIGIARDVGLAPGWMEHVVYGFVTLRTLAQLGLPATLNELQIVVTDREATQDEVRRVAYAVKAEVVAAGHPVFDVDVPVPGEHIHAAQMDSLIYTQGAFGLLALVVAAFLVVNLIAAMLTGQVREIGVMKTLGAQNSDLSRMYLTLALGLGVFASLLSLPVAYAAGREYASLKAELLNFDVRQYAIPAWAIVLQLLIGAFLPVVAAALPVRRGSRISVAVALRDVGLERDTSGTDPMFTSLGVLPRPTLLSIRNAFRKRQRMVLTLLALASGGSVYLGARNLRTSVIGSLDLLYGSQRYDFSIRISDPQSPARLESAVLGVAGVTGAEAWASARAAVARADGTLGNSFPISAPPAATRLLVPSELEGRWLTPADTNALVVNRTLLKTEGALRLGHSTKLVIGGATRVWTVVGIVDVGPAPSAFSSREALTRVTGDSLASAVVVATDIDGIVSQVDLIQRVRSELDGLGWRAAGSQLLAESRRVTQDHLVMVVDFLAAMGWVMIVVGGMGLASTMGLAVLERTREIGVMRAIGVRHGSILTMIQVEGLVVALLSWLVALPLSVPMSVVLGEAFGRVMLKVPLTWIPDSTGVLRWLAVVVSVSVVACAWPSLRATRITIARALAYE